MSEQNNLSKMYCKFMKLILDKNNINMNKTIARKKQQKKLSFYTVDPDANILIPESVIIEFEGESSRIYLINDTIHCVNYENS